LQEARRTTGGHHRIAKTHKAHHQAVAFYGPRIQADGIDQWITVSGEEFHVRSAKTPHDHCYRVTRRIDCACAAQV
jgi:hypothetical protein